MKYKILLFTFIFCFSFLFLSSAFLAWFIDPLKLFHKPFLCEKTIYDDARYSVRGMIDTMDFDSVILGTSMLENTSAKEANEKLNGNFINISTSGSSFFERKIIFDYLLKHKNIKHVFYSFDKFAILQKENYIVENYQLDKYYFLYDNNPFNDFKAYLNAKYIGYMLKTFLTFGKKCKILDLDRPFAWYMLENYKQRFGGIENFAKYNYNERLKENIKKAINTKIKKENIISFKENLDNNIIYFAKKYPQTNFILVIPPYSMVQSAMYAREPKLFEAHKKAVKYLLEQNLKNLKIYAFDDMNFTSDIANYKDLGHYSEKINSKMLDWVANDIGLLTLENFEIWWQNYENIAKSFDLEGFNNKLQNLIKKSSQK